MWILVVFLLKDVVVMDEYVYQVLTNYYNVLDSVGYQPHSISKKLLILCFYKNIIYGDYRGRFSKEDWILIEKALDCLYGSECLIPYPDYMKKGKLHLGELSELAQRVQDLEDTNVLKVIHDEEAYPGTDDSDIMFVPVTED